MLPRFLIGIAIASVVAIAIYWPGLNGPFVFDDLPNILTNPTLRMFELTIAALFNAAGSGTDSLVGRPLAYISFAVNHWMAGGFDPWVFKLTNVGLHVANAALVFLIATRALPRLARIDASDKRILWVGAAVALVWMVHPIQLTTVLYTVQRMAGLAAFFVLFGCWLYLIGRERVAGQRPFGIALMASAIVLGLFGGLASKENAAVLIPLLLVLEWSVYRRDSADQRVLQAFKWVFLLTPCFLGLAYLATHPNLVFEAYNVRDFDVGERLMSQARILFIYLGWLFVPTLDALSLVHDDIAVSRGLLLPGSTLAALVAWVVVATVAIALRRRFPELGFALLWFLAAHSIESSVIGLDLVHEHRNYLP
ncbi:MAG: hypothetical protein K0U93_01200, partial [Gammaproteobacteria bacterium]|nr:hypothetical protein [Gammaproteobacteria bacterium]